MSQCALVESDQCWSGNEVNVAHLFMLIKMYSIQGGLASVRANSPWIKYDHRIKQHNCVS